MSHSDFPLSVSTKPTPSREPSDAQTPRASLGPAIENLPPNFVFAQVQDVTPLGSDFLRVTLQADDLSRHGNDAIHFRLLQPSLTHETLWPSLTPNGSVLWPQGPGATHKPVYTARSVDHARNLLVTDIFVHDGGRTTAWAQEILAGHLSRRVVGLLGPSGGGLIAADRVLMASDETGFPAAARILEALPKDATGTVFLEAEHGARCGYPFAVPQGVALHWLSRAEGACLADATLEALPRHRDAKLWFAGERTQARRLRDAAKALGCAAEDMRVSGFWRKETP